VTGSKRLILVVDDTEDNRIILEHFLENAGYEVALASDGMKGLEAAQALRPAAILLDVMMPGMTGLEVLSKLRERPEMVNLPVIMVTARSESRSIVEALHSGASDYVSKPIDYDVLIARLETHLSLARLQDELVEANQLLQEQMEAARSVQESLMPRREAVGSLPGSYGLEAAGLWRPSMTLGGDFWDLVSLADGSVGLFLVGFEGAGLIPSLHTFRMKSFLHGQCAGIYNASLALARINAQLCTFLPEGDLATGLYARFDPDRRQFTVSSGGGPGPLVWREGSGSLERLVVEGAPLGKSPESVYREAVLEMNPGDIAVFFTDGLLNYGSRRHGAYTEKRLGELLARNYGKSPEELARLLDEDVSRIEGPSSEHDDVTAIVLRLAGD